MLLLSILSLSYSKVSEQQLASISAKAEIQAIVVFTIDGTDSGTSASGNEIINLGNVDAGGTPISGAPAGNPDVNGVTGIPVNSSGNPLSSQTDPNSIGAFYPIFSATGSNHHHKHPSSALSAFVFIKPFNEVWQVSVRAQLISSSSNVTIDQLKWKYDATPSIGFQGFTDFSTSETVLLTGNSRIREYLYIDYGILVEYDDEPGNNTWVVTYTVTST